MATTDSAPNLGDPLSLSDPLGVLEHAPMGFAVLSPDFTIRYLNVAGAQIARVDRAAAVGQNLLTLFPAAAGTPIIARFQQALEQGAPMQFEEYLPRRERWLSFTLYTSADGLVVYCRDTTDQHRAATQLQSSEGRLQRVIDVSQSGVWDIDLRAQTAVFSARFEEIFGVEPGTSPHRPDAFERFIVPEDLDALKAAAGAAIIAQSPYVHEFRIRRPDGQLVWVRLRGEVECDEAGVPVRALGIVTNISDRVAAAEALRDSQRQLALAQRLAGIGSWSWDLASGAVSWSEEMFRIQGYDPAGTVPSFEKVLEVAVDSERQHEFMSRVQQALAGEADYDFVMPMKRPDGVIRIIHTRGEVERAPDGTPLGMTGTAEDVTERQERDAAMLASEQRFRTLAESSPLGVFLLNEHGHGTYANPRLLALYHVTFDEYAKGDWRQRIHPDDAAQVEAVSRETLAKRLSYRAEHRVLQPDGRTRTARTTMAPVYAADDRFSGYVGAVEDITEEVEAAGERERLERQVQHAQKLESLGVLAGGIAHDFNNLLVGILTNASLALLDVPPQTPVQEAVQDIEHAAQRAAELTRQLLAYSGKGRFIIEPISLSAVTGEMAHLLRTVVSKNAHLTLDLDDNLPAVRGDATQLRQIVMNLITNASDALHDAEGAITVRTRRTESVEDVSPLHFVGEPATGGPWVRLEVMDSGSGMDQDTLSRIFDPFFTTKFTGRGLGLAATIGIMRGHQGAIAVQSAPGQGTTFTLFFPPIEAAPRRITPPSQPVVAQGFGTVLVVDDDAGVRRVAEALLERQGFRVVSATDGRQAVELCRTNPGAYRAVLLDLTMPVMGGSEAFHRIRELEASLPIILMSGYSDVQIEQTFGEHQLAGFLQKPFRAQDLYAVVAAAVTV